MKINGYIIWASLLVAIILFISPCRSLAISAQLKTSLYDGIIRMYWGYKIKGLLFSIPFLNVFTLPIVLFQIKRRYERTSFVFQGILILAFTIHNYYFIGIWNGSTSPLLAFYLILSMGIATATLCFVQGWLIRRYNISSRRS